MNTPEDRLNRLLKAAQEACPPIPLPSPWFEQRMIHFLREETNPFSSYLDGFPLWRILTFAGVVMAVSVTLTLIQTKNPYLETMEWADTPVLAEKIP
jgi:hypothetical protein